MSAPLSAAEQRELAALLAQALVDFLADPRSWQSPQRVLPPQRDVLWRVALALAERLAPLVAAKHDQTLTPAELDALAAAAAARCCEQARARFGGRSVWVDSPATAQRRRAEEIIAAAIRGGLPLAPAFRQAGVSRATGYRIRDRLLARRAR